MLMHNNQPQQLPLLQPQQPHNNTPTNIRKISTYAVEVLLILRIETTPTSEPAAKRLKVESKAQAELPKQPTIESYLQPKAE